MKGRCDNNQQKVDINKTVVHTVLYLHYFVESILVEFTIRLVKKVLAEPRPEGVEHLWHKNCTLIMVH